MGQVEEAGETNLWIGKSRGMITHVGISRKVALALRRAEALEKPAEDKVALKRAEQVSIESSQRSDIA